MLKKRTFNLDMSNLSDSKLGKTIQKSTVSFSISIQLDWEYLTTQLDPRWTMKLQHLQTIQTSHCQRMSKTWHHDMLQHSAEPTTHQALAPSAPIWFSLKLMFATEAFIFSASAKAWRQGQIKVGILFVVSTVKTWSLKPHEQFTFNLRTKASACFLTRAGARETPPHPYGMAQTWSAPTSTIAIGS